MAFNPSTASNSKTILINSGKIDATLTNFPVAIDLAEHGGSIFTDLGVNKLKLAVTTSDGVTQCPIEIEHWDNSGGKGVLHVKIPFISSSTNTEIKLFWDNIQDDNTTYVGVTGSTVAQGVWDTNFVGVYHMAQDPSGGAGCIKDSTSYATHGTPQGSMTIDDLADGLLGKAVEFDGIDDYIDFGDVTVLDGATSATFEVAIKFKSMVTEGVYIRKWRAGEQSFSFGNILGSPCDEITLMINDATQNQELRKTSSNAALAIGENYLFAGVWEGSNVTRIHKDGISLLLTTDSNGNPTSIANVAEHSAIAAKYDGGSPTKINDVIIGELRLSVTPRSTAWIKATNASLKDELFKSTVIPAIISVLEIKNIIKFALNHIPNFGGV